ncbi:sensor histidine kinase [Streptomyces sp. NPDC003781]|uniref:sensor histidine kinase n=1 Tax=Streptomyces sp. NPDC003781 TaxID=3364686 RepID=UPI00369B0042
MDVAETPRAGLPLRTRLMAASPWPRKRIVAEAALALALSGAAGLLYTAETGSLAKGGALGLIVAALSLARRAFPATVLAASSALAGAALGAAALLMCASWSAGSRLKRPARALAVYAAGLALYLVLDFTTTADDGLGLSPLISAVLSGGPFLVLTVVPGLASRYRAQRHALLDALQRHNAQLVREQAMVAQQARLVERQRIAQDMHDSLGHQLALVSVHAGALEVDPELGDRQREGVRILREASRTAMRELREAVGILRDEVEATAADREGSTPPPARVAASLDSLVSSSRAAGTVVDLRRSGTWRPLAPAADHAVYRIAQECLTNAHKHAPGAPITVALRYEPDSLVVEVANGPVPSGAPAGPPAVSGGQGLAGLKERARLIGGMVHAGPTPDGGFRVAGVLPYGSGETVKPAGETTSVAAGDHFRWQTGPGSASEGEAVTEHRSDPQKEFAAIMSSRKNTALGCVLTAVGLVVSVGALLIWGVYELLDEVESGVIPASVYESAEVGDAEADLRKQLPDGDSLLTDGVEKDGPPLPEDAVCEHFIDEVADTVYRFCFRDGKLSSKESYPHEI